MFGDYALARMDSLAGAFRRGEPDAIRALYQQYGGPVATVARSILGNPQLVEEAVQQTFVNAWRAASKFDENRDLAPWLYSIARRCSIDILRREAKPTAGGHEPEVDVAVDPPSFERAYEAFEVRRAMQALPKDERAVVELSHRFGLSHPEIAARLGVPVGTVKSRSNRAHKRLAAALRHLDEIANQKAEFTVQGGEEVT